MKTQDIRERFISYFTSKGHQNVPSSPAIPEDDPTLLFTNAGMNQFKDYFTGKKVPERKKVVTIQKCIRAGGKHNDLENVGQTARHHTFFEMMGNFSFGSYFKKEAIEYAWEFLTTDLKIPEERLYISIHHSDKDAFNLWHKNIGISKKKIFKKGDKDNFWEMGEYGPCGPCSEIFYDHGEQYSHLQPPSKTSDLIDNELRFIEIWNLVFMQYEKTKKGQIPLPNPSIDTGAGLERISAILQNVYWNYDTDLFLPLIKEIEKITGKKYNDKQYSTNIRIIADHIRSCTILITDGVIPANDGRGYVLRRIIRRAVKSIQELGCKTTCFYKLVPTVFKILGSAYPQNKVNAPLAEKILCLEEEKFLETLDHGLKYLDDCIKKINGTILPGDHAFKLYDTFGLPLDLTENILKKRNLDVDKKGFKKHMLKTQEQSRKTWKGEHFTDKSLYFPLYEKYGDSNFTGYDCYSTQGKLLEILPLDKNINALIFDKTPFYGESGGQVGDTGNIYSIDDKNEDKPLASIFDTQKPLNNIIIHYSKSSKKLQVGEKYHLKVDIKRRNQIAKNHSATHLLQAALINVLGNHVRQSGSLVSEKKLRFDYTHMKMPSKKELEDVERLINEQIKKGLTVQTSYMDKNTAIKKGALAFFGEKYEQKVRVLSMENFSTELCGGTHVENTSQIGLFIIISEGSLSSGVRRMECLTGEPAITYLQNRSKVLDKIESITKVKEDSNINYLQNTFEEIKDKQKEIKHLKDKLITANSDLLFSNPEKLKKDIIFKTINAPKDLDMRKLSDIFISKNKNGIVLIHRKSNDKTLFLLRSSKQIKIDCSSLLKTSLKRISGNGGGKSEIAQGSGDLKNLDSFIKKLKEDIIKNL